MGRSPTPLEGRCGSFTGISTDEMMNADSQEAPEAITPEACWQVLERAARSRALKRAARLREFLLYVGAQSLKEGRSDLHEQELGETVFGRPPAYDTSQDNIVRVSATELRKRVDAYFASEGKDEPLIFEIPRGSYMPSFRLRAPRLLSTDPVASAGTPESPADSQIPAPSPLPRRFLPAILAVVAIVLGIICALLWQENRSLHRQMRDCRCTTSQP